MDVIERAMGEAIRAYIILALLSWLILCWALFKSVGLILRAFGMEPHNRALRMAGLSFLALLALSGFIAQLGSVVLVNYLVLVAIARIVELRNANLVERPFDRTQLLRDTLTDWW